MEGKVKLLKKSVDDAILLHTTAKEERKKLAEKEASMTKQLDNLKDEMRESIQKERRHYEEMIEKSNRDRDEMQREFERKRTEIENESEKRCQAIKDDYERQCKLNDQKRELEIHTMAVAAQKIKDEAQRLDAAYRESKKTSVAEMMLKGCAFTAGALMVLAAPEIVPVIGVVSLLRAASQK